jgi:hypothetical protein
MVMILIMVFVIVILLLIIIAIVIVIIIVVVVIVFLFRLCSIFHLHPSLEIDLPPVCYLTHCTLILPEIPSRISE